MNIYEFDEFHNPDNEAVIKEGWKEEEPKQMVATCPNCGGSGTIDKYETYAVCCGNLDKYGGCCNDPDPEERNVGECCPACNGTGKITR